jgi:hypothetical protein
MLIPGNNEFLYESSAAEPDQIDPDLVPVSALDLKITAPLDKFKLKWLLLLRLNIDVKIIRNLTF